MTTQTRYDLLLRGGELLDPGQEIHGKQDIAFKEGRVAEVGENLDRAGALRWWMSRASWCPRPH